MITLKRVYEEASSKDGQRVLVERLWPRGVTKEKAAIDLWLKDIAPSTELRKWYNHDLEKWDEFRKRYDRELENNESALATMKELMAKGPVTFVYASHDQQHNSALVLKEYLENQR